MSSYRHLVHVVPDRDGAWVLAPGGTARLDTPDKPLPEWSETDWAMAEEMGLLDPAFGDWYGVTLFVTTACNLRCSYCFQNLHGGGKRIPAKRLSSSVLKWAAHEAVEKAELVGARRLALTLMGGEPLVAQGVCFEALRLFGERFDAMDAELVTNGTLLREEDLPRWEGLGLTGIQVTLDGGRKSHDSVRVSKAYPRTFDRICRLVAAILDCTSLRVVLRVNISPDLLREAPGMLVEINREVPLAHPSLVLDIAPVVGLDWNSCFPSEVQQEALWETLLNTAAELGVGLPVPQISACLHCSEPRGARGLVVGPGGLLYQNWAEAGREELAVGRVTAEGGIWSPVDLWRSCALPAKGLAAPQHSFVYPESYWRVALRQAHGR